MSEETKAITAQPALSLAKLDSFFVSNEFPPDSKGSTANYETFNTGNVSLKEAQALLGKFIGIQGQVRAALTADIENAFEEAMSMGVAKHSGDKYEKPVIRRNMAITGPTGAGKSAYAKAFGIYATISGMAPTRTVLFVPAANIIGEYYGHSEGRLNTVFKKARGGVIIIDEIDKLPERRGGFGGDAAHHLNGNMETETSHGTLFIVTGHKEGVAQFFRMDNGLEGRFPNLFDMPAYNEQQLAAILEDKISARRMLITPDAMTMAMRQIMAAKDDLGILFSNARAVENYLGIMFKTHAHSANPDDVAALRQGKNIPASAWDAIRTLTETDVAFYNKGSKKFVVGGTPGSGSPVISLAEMRPKAGS